MNGGIILVDAHVHLHSNFESAALLNAAGSNFDRWAERLFPGTPYTGVLFLTEGKQERGFDRLLNWAEKPGDSEARRSFKRTENEEATSLVFAGKDDRKLIIIAGRQIVTAERLEVLAVGTRNRFEEGAPADELIRQAADAGALPIVPWGVGKWTGKRKEIVSGLLENHELPQFFLGDSANRPKFWPLSTLFRQAEKIGIRNLPGTDPLPFPGEWRRPGSFGFVIQVALEASRPAMKLLATLRNPSTAIRTFGSGATPGRFLHHQVRMQLRNQTLRNGFES